ncbi:MAG TPA: NADPH-dependent FMN reductase [Marinobacter sp.]|nr:NADPH-dependent FMN reductase [Marinobacter sp.]
MLVTVLLGSPSLYSRSSALAEYSRVLLEQRGIDTQFIGVRQFNAEDLLHARSESPAVKDYVRSVQDSAGLILATPVYKASFAGALKVLLDLLPERSLEQKLVLPLVTGGSEGHLLAVDYALQPVLSGLKAKQIFNAVYATDRQVTLGVGGELTLESRLKERLDRAIQLFSDSLPGALAHTDPHLLYERVRNAQLSI